MNQRKNHLSNTALHGKEERVKRIFRDQIAEAAGLLEVVLSGIVLEVLLYAIARHMIVGHEDAVQNLVSVIAIALIFVIRRYFFVPSFGQKLPGGQMAPDVAHLYAVSEEEGVELGEEPH